MPPKPSLPRSTATAGPRQPQGRESPRHALGLAWNPERPHVMVIACSDGRLQGATDEFLHNQLNIGDYDRLYVPGGGGALSPSGSEFTRASRHQEECRFLVEAHDVQQLIVLFHGPAPGGPDASMCADYTRKFKWASIKELLAQQERDAKELLESRWQWAVKAKISMYRCEVSADTSLAFLPLHTDP